MASLLRSLTGTVRPSTQLSRIATQPRRLAHSSYGNVQSGHEQGLNEPNPKRHLEHPGPEAPASKDSAGKSTTSSSDKASNNAHPTIQQPESAAEDRDPDVRKHNEEMRHRADRSANQLGEGDSKVDKNFWKGDVGDINNPDKKR